MGNILGRKVEWMQEFIWRLLPPTLPHSPPPEKDEACQADVQSSQISAHPTVIGQVEHSFLDYHIANDGGTDL